MFFYPEMPSGFHVKRPTDITLYHKNVVPLLLYFAVAFCHFIYITHLVILGYSWTRVYLVIGN